MRHALAEDFGDFEGRTWLNCAHQGPLPLLAAEEAHEAVAWKLAPHQLTAARFSGVPIRLKEALGRLIGASAEDVILGNSASYGLHLLANGLPLQPGDEVLLMKGDFPSNILPWLVHREKGIGLRLIQPAQHIVQPDELTANLSAATKVFCTSWVHSFSGCATDIEALGEICRAHGILFIVNCSQALGARPLEVSKAPLDAIVGVGFKWLCGPYGTGFCWIRPELRETLAYNQAYWLTMLTAEDLGRDQEDNLEPKGNLGARQYDVFGTANFFNFKTWAASVEYLLAQGIDHIRDHDERLVSRFVEGLDQKKYNLISPADGPGRSTLIFVAHKDSGRNREIYQLLKRRGIDIAFRKNRLRFAPHLYNTEADIDRALLVLSSVV